MQDFIVSVSNLETGEQWEVCVPAGEPALALNKVLRRKLFGEFLLSEQAFRFVVQDKASYTRSDPEIEWFKCQYCGFDGPLELGDYPEDCPQCK